MARLHGSEGVKPHTIIRPSCWIPRSCKRRSSQRHYSSISGRTRFVSGVITGEAILGTTSTPKLLCTPSLLLLQEARFTVAPVPGDCMLLNAPWTPSNIDCILLNAPWTPSNTDFEHALFTCHFETPSSTDFNMLMMMKQSFMSSDVGWHIRDKLWPVQKHGSMFLYVHRNRKAH